MNTKTFAQQSRALLMEGVANKLMYWGFNKDGSISEEPNPVAGGYVFRGKVFDDETVPKLWRSLHQAIKTKGIEVVKEEAAYTWFNRIMALQIMAKNDYLDAQLVYVPGMANTPQILQKARQGQYAFLSSKEQERLKRIITDFSQEQEAFALLLVGYCHSNKMLNNVFGKLDDYTELLLPVNMLQDNGFLHLLNTTDAISDEQYKEVELIGWLYQFYISERKDEVFASFKKKKKAEAKDIPAATQIFTPNWIVKYMVQNTVGKIWLDKNPNSKIKSSLKYLVESDTSTDLIAGSDSTSEPIISEVSQLTLIDPAVGSGHILVEGFDLLYQMYMEEYYTPEEAVESILKNNLFGLDLDDRAAQLATFAILLKAAKQYRDVFTKGWLPNVYAMPEYAAFNEQEIKDFLGTDGTSYEKELKLALSLMEQSKNLGSAMKLYISDDTRAFIEKRFVELENTEYRDINAEIVFQKIKTFIPVLLILSKKYTAVVANPPYMGQKSMNDKLNVYLFKHYPQSYGDLCTVFMDVSFELLIHNGIYSMINQASWMLKPSFKELRESLIQKHSIDLSLDTLLYLGPGVFPELKGEVVQSVCFSVRKRKQLFTMMYKLNLYTDSLKKQKGFLSKESLPFKKYITEFDAFAGKQFGFWLKTELLENFELNPIRKYGDAKQGIKTGKNPYFIKFWHEISAKKLDEKWFPLETGGGFRKWFGNNDNVLNWENDGYEIKNFKDEQGNLRSRPQNLDFFFTAGLTWSTSAGKKPSFRYSTDNFCFESSGSKYFVLTGEYSLYHFLAFFNSNVTQYMIEVFAPGIGFSEGSIKSLPFIEIPGTKKHLVENNSIEAISICQKDWNEHETSWDFEKNSILNNSNSIKIAFEKWQEEIAQDFFQLHKIEEELNRIFIEIYELQNELTPEVALKDITILQDELKKNDLEALEEKFRANGKDAIELPINRSEVISQFISYAIGLFMGRYRLDKPGLNIAHPNPSKEELASYTYNHGEVIIDQDAILPIMGKNCNFNDDIVKQFTQLLDTIWGHEQRTENINFIQECLDKDLEKFLVNDFWNYHCSMYKKTPIYWLFSSNKGAFQVLVYMHRINEFTVEKIRANYLLEHLKYLKSEIAQKEANARNLSTAEAKQLDKLRVDLIECEQYDLALKNVADQQIKFDLDDGVAKNYELFETVVAKIK
jgi:hypothetical protein